jgi:hypothetical protein
MPWPISCPPGYFLLCEKDSTRTSANLQANDTPGRSLWCCNSFPVHDNMPISEKGHQFCMNHGVVYHLTPNFLPRDLIHAACSFLAF